MAMVALVVGYGQEGERGTSTGHADFILNNVQDIPAGAVLFSAPTILDVAWLTPIRHVLCPQEAGA
jgi:hypothetical protein